MKKLNFVTALLCLSLPTVVNATEFQPLGAVGIGGAGVARTIDAYASYWNPAGLAFYQKPFSARFNAGVGININSSLADNVDKLGKMDINDLKNLSFTSITPPQAALSSTAQAVEFVGIVNDLDRNRGTLTVTPGGVLAFQYRNYGFAAVVTSELSSFPESDTTTIRPGDPTVSSVTNFATGIGAVAGTPASPVQLFSQTQRDQIAAAFQASGASPAVAQAIVNKLETQLTSAGGNKSGQSSQQLTDAMIRMGQSFSNNAGSIENNNSTVEFRGIILSEIPIAYGYKFDLGKLGQVGVGGAIKIMNGTTFASSVQLVSIKDSGDLVKKATDRKTDSINVGVDLGALWRNELPVVGPLNVGVVLKNLNSPEFDLPQFTVTTVGRNSGGALSNQKVRVDPQARMGAALDPLSWLTVAADMDLTKNSTVLPGHDSQNIGGGVDIHPLNWFAVRAGMFGNVADSSAGPVATGGLSFGPKWLRLDLDAAVALESGKYKNNTYPREAKVEFGLSTML